MAAANGDKGFVVPELEIKFTKLFINGQFVDAVSGKHLFPSAWLQSSLFFSTAFRAVAGVLMRCSLAAAKAPAGRSIFFLFLG
jgi:hypothetical protein